MNTLAVAVLLVTVACANASGILGAGLLGTSAKGALEGALGGQWIPDVPVAASGAVVAPAAAAAIAAGPLGLGLGGLGLGGVGLHGVGLGGVGLGGVGIGGLGLGLGAHGIASKGALEGALGGQWIPDTHGK